MLDVSVLRLFSGVVERLTFEVGKLATIGATVESKLFTMDDSCVLRAGVGLLTGVFTTPTEPVPVLGVTTVGCVVTITGATRLGSCSETSGVTADVSEPRPKLKTRRSSSGSTVSRARAGRRRAGDDLFMASPLGS
jgi:hypothetical protein